MADKEIFYKNELEELVGKLYNGDMTVLVYELLKDTHDMDSLLEYLTGERPESNLDVVEEEIHNTPNFRDWFSSCTEVGD